MPSRARTTALHGPHCMLHEREYVTLAFAFRAPIKPTRDNPPSATPHARLLKLQLPQCPEALIVALCDYISRTCFASQTTIVAPTLPDSIRTTTPTVLSDRTPAPSGFRKAPRPLSWLRPSSCGSPGVCGAQGSLQLFYPSRRRHGGGEGPTEGCRGGRAERHVSKPTLAPRTETRQFWSSAPSSLGSQESGSPETRV